MNFENTDIAFAYKSDADLKRAHFLFSCIRFPVFTKLLSRMIPLLLRWKFPIEGIIRKTLFRQFVAGENLYETKNVVHHLNQFKVQAILDYGVEGGEEQESVKAANAEGFIHAIEGASSNPMIPFVSIKMSAIASVKLMENMQVVMRQKAGSLIERYEQASQQLSGDEKNAWESVEKRLHKILGIASLYKVRVLVDAEESWIQDTIDGLITKVASLYNKGYPLVYYTIQLYRHDRLSFLHTLYGYSKVENFNLGVKLVRGAYMEKERRRAHRMRYPSPLHLTKEATDRDFDSALEFCMDHTDNIAVVLATHNEKSCLHAAGILKMHDDQRRNINFHFSQLFGMSDHITFTLAKEGYSASKYLPYGPLAQVVPYLMRRAQENNSVQGQGVREFFLIAKEMRRRAI